MIVLIRSKTLAIKPREDSQMAHVLTHTKSEAIRTLKLVAGIATSIVELGIPGIPEIATQSPPTALVLEIQEITVSNEQRDPENLRKQSLYQNPKTLTGTRNAETPPASSSATLSCTQIPHILLI
jgi:hypothetical protein